MKQVKGNSLRFWKESVVYFRNKKDKSTTVADFVDNTELLRTCREQVKRLERRILHLVIIVNLAVLLSIFASGCQTFDGVKGDIHWLTADNDHSVQEK